MRELINNLLGNRYNTVNPTDGSLTVEQHRSLQANRGFERGFSVVDSFFQTRKGSGKRWPTCKSLNSILSTQIHLEFLETKLGCLSLMSANN